MGIDILGIDILAPTQLKYKYKVHYSHKIHS